MNMKYSYSQKQLFMDRCWDMTNACARKVFLLNVSMNDEDKDDFGLKDK